MGIIIAKKDLNRTNYYNLLIYCCELSDLSPDKLISINKLIANELIKLTTNNLKSINMDKIVLKVLNNFPDNKIVKDFEVLFNPNYDIDILNLFISLRKYNEFCLLWPGVLSNNKLIYSEEVYEDYKSFDINKYDVTCVI